MTENSFGADGAHLFYEDFMIVGSDGSSKAVENLEKAIVFINRSLESGMIMNDESISANCKVLAGVGAIISVGIQKLKNGSAEKFDSLKQKIRQLYEKIIVKFDELKSFISGTEFAMEVIGEVGVLKKFLMDVFELSTKEAIESFKGVYELNTPLNIAYTISSLLAQISTNPLEIGKKFGEKSALETFIKIIVGDLVFLEALATGLFKKLNMYDLERLIGEIIDIEDLIDDIDDNKEKITWDDFKKDFPDFIKAVIQKDNSTAEKVEEIQKKLEEELPDDAFYIGVFENAEYETDFYYHVGNHDNFLESRNVESGYGEKFNVFVYRSEKAGVYSEKDYEELEEAMEVLSTYDHKLTNKELVDIMTGSESTGFIALINYDRGAQISFANCPDHAKGPGNWTQVWLGRNKRGVDFIVGYP
ncbi:hypothetical protein CAEBREN_24293 [Caenorhabditis brenneri]|uniref:Uncharacterized protein n=1 Tax=Caenorhabditis brenneri TaxID=135651 RepID=G0NXG1_CAEBE|nr:hypothetical protein CAEBREN_24293 [Caenorhabditis brenneri]